MSTNYDPITDQWVSTWCSGGTTITLTTECQGSTTCEEAHRESLARWLDSFPENC